MVKLLGRAKRLNEALKLAEDYRKVLEIFSGFLWECASIALQNGPWVLPQRSP